MNRTAHQAYWNSEAGRDLLEQIQGLIAANYVNGEREPERAGVHLARAAGVREVLTVVQSISAPSKSG